MTDTTMESKALQPYIDHINSQFHLFNKLYWKYASHSGKYRIYYLNDDKEIVGLSAWLELEDARHYLNNFIDMFCMDRNNPERYFEFNKSAVLVHLDDLIPEQKPEKEVMSAQIDMRKAYTGKGCLIAPLAVSEAETAEDGSFYIEDGSEYYFVAKMMGIKQVPVIHFQHQNNNTLQQNNI